MPVGFQAGLRLVDWVLSGASVDLDFANNRFFGSSGGTVISYLNIARASIGNAKNSAGIWIPFSANTLRITDLGLLIEDARTNNLLQSETPATQTTGSLATGSYTLWVEGSGSALASGGSATITGAASATAGSPNTFSVTVAGTVIVTVTGSLTRFQLEDGAFASSYIPTTTTSVTRAADYITTIGPLETVLETLPMSVMINIFAIDAGQVSTASPKILSDTNGIGGASHLYIPAANNIVGTIDTNGAHAALTANFPGGVLYTTGAKVATGQSSGGRSVVGGGGTVATDANFLTLVGPGRLGSFSYPFAYFRRFTAWNSRLADATLQALTT